MAIWQFTIYLVPESACSADGTLPGLSVTDDGFELPRCRFIVPSERLEKLAVGVLPAGKSWHKDLHAFGDEDRHDIQLWYEDGELRDACIRIDLRNITRELISQIVQLATDAQCRFFVVETQRVLPADEMALLSAMQQSRSAKFVRDPRGFLESLAAERRPE